MFKKDHLTHFKNRLDLVENILANQKQANLLALEFGFKVAEKGWNLETAIEKYLEMTEKEVKE